MRSKLELLKSFFENTKEDGIWGNIGIAFLLIVSFPLSLLLVLISLFVAGIHLIIFNLWELTGLPEKRRKFNYHRKIIIFLGLSPEATKEEIKEAEHIYMMHEEKPPYCINSYEFEQKIISKKEWNDYYKNYKK